MKRENFASGGERSKPAHFNEDKIDIIVDKDERYPDFSIDSRESIPSSWDTPAVNARKRYEITREQYEWLRRIEKEYNQGQEFLAKLTNWRE